MASSLMSANGCTSFVIFLVLLYVIQFTQCKGARPEEGSVYVTDGKARFVSGRLDKVGAAAYATYSKQLLTKGWNVLDIKAGYGNLTSSYDLMYAAGYIEGYMTASDIWNQYQNLKQVFLDPAKPTSNKTEYLYRKFFKAQDAWTRAMMAKHGAKDDYWRHVSYVTAQFDGLSSGYMDAAQPGWDSEVFVLQYLNAVGDMIDLRHALVPEPRPQFHNMTKEEILHYHRTHGHCSALVKITGAYENIYMAHSSWFDYRSTLRIYKHYDFNLKDKATAARAMSFSSYPAFLESLDDFYLLSSGLVMLQTTNNIFNTSLYDLITSESLLAWQRVRIANHMAHGGKQWRDVLAMYNSGTYNNQYMIIDLSKIHLEKSVDDDALWVVEQIPGLVVGADQSPILRAGYWPSYNVPFFEDIYNISGYPQMVSKAGLDVSYQLAPRAKIFRRDQDNVFYMKGMETVMRYNDYVHDNYSDSNLWNSICSRGDLAHPSSTDGCYDSKVTDYAMALKRQSYVINGPTLSSNLPPFSWTGPFEHFSHHGLPKTYNFPWMFMKPSL